MILSDLGRSISSKNNFVMVLWIRVTKFTQINTFQINSYSVNTLDIINYIIYDFDLRKIMYICT